MERLLLMMSGVSGALGVLLGAFGAHGLKTFLAGLEDGAERRGFWETAAHYHLIHALAIGLAAYLAGKNGGGAATASGFCFLAGIVLFSGSLYAMTLTDIRALGAITPIGGVLFVAGWTLLAIAAYRLP